MRKVKNFFHNLLAFIRPLKNSSALIMTRSYFFLLAIITFSMVISVPIVLGYQLIRIQVQNANQYIKSLKKTNIDSAHDWNIWIRNNTFDSDVIFIKAQTNKKKTFYSDGASHVASKNYKHLFFSKKYLLDSKNWHDFNHYKLYYTKTVTQYGNHFTVWINLYKVFNIIKITLYTLLIIICLVLIFGVWLIWQLSQRLTTPLSYLSSATEKVSLKIKQSNQRMEDRLPEPTSPTEVNELAVSFNQLLDVISEKEVREKQFVSDASHELKTPIAAINGHLKLIKRRGREHPEIIENSFDYISNETRRMQHLVQNLLDLSHAERDELNITKINLSELLVEISKNVPFPQKIKTKFSSNIYIKADLDQIHEIILAILENSSKYSPLDCPIILNIERNSGKTIMRIIDFGKGISANDKKHIFERFYRADASRSNSIPGSGLGLSIVKELANRQHIKINVLDNYPRGTIFELSLPR
ncbi:histidine kinase [Oenococcus oeni S25]|uniref:sensor histidine kinase n=3 Tax=Oenococcus oeni TaxID=1247 RepID=UPI00050F58E7|nr:HAMP domain-containing sensor histidine kinase [Oenococcus oeni]KGH56791.1 histidine kinase [Oenococcus oeni S22]KGH71041.1 histidine kinase [Oenococcus oeni S25]KGO16354.1 histidine kinase [Oenococcus oeni X2L]KGH80597.1 histidine kinase [Oenococcus oeni IOEB_0607]OIK63352.1 two-component sensor histidine kinase [Oenococcus oeni]